MRRIIAALLIICASCLPAWATVQSSANTVTVYGNASQTQFNFSFVGVASQYISVLYTDPSGNQSGLTQGAGSNQYQITLNPAVTGAIWGFGGTITYNPGGTPIPNGSSLTIIRTLPLTQNTSLQNLSSIAVLGKGAETGLDTGVMQSQQISSTINRSILANVANALPPLPLPPAAQLANMGLCGDSSGNNIIACTLPSSGIISSAMQPVVDAATLSLGRTALGLGTMATENINGGSCGGSTIQDDGSGNARVVFAQVADSTGQSVTCAFSQTQRVATGPITYTLPRANTLFAGWNFRVIVVTGQVTFTTNAADNFPGVASGGSMTVSAGSSCTLSTNAASSGTWQINCSSSPPSLTANASANALTLTLSGSLINFRDPTISQGDAIWANITSGVSITLPTGATLGTSNGVPFRVWIFAAYNSGTPVLGVATCSSSSGVLPCRTWEVQQKSGTAITSGATSLGTLYTASTVTNDAVRIIGYAEYSSGLTTAGTWASGPTKVQLCISPYRCNYPGDIVQGPLYNSTTSNTSCTSGSFTATGVAQSISPTSSVNLIRYVAAGSAANITTGDSVYIKMYRAGTAIGVLLVATSGVGSALVPVTVLGLDAPGSTSSLSYAVNCETNASTGSFPSTSGGNIIIEEIMG